MAVAVPVVNEAGEKREQEKTAADDPAASAAGAQAAARAAAAQQAQSAGGGAVPGAQKIVEVQFNRVKQMPSSCKWLIK